MSACLFVPKVRGENSYGRAGIYLISSSSHETVHTVQLRCQRDKKEVVGKRTFLSLGIQKPPPQCKKNALLVFLCNGISFCIGLEQKEDNGNRNRTRSSNMKRAKVSPRNITLS